MPRESTTLQAGDPAPAFRLPAVEGGQVSLEDLLNGQKALALLFLRGTW